MAPSKVLPQSFILTLALVYSINAHAQISFTANPNPVTLAAGTTVGKTTLAWSAPGHSSLRVVAGSTLFAAGLPSSGSADTGNWVSDGLIFSLVDSVNGATLSTITVHTTAANGSVSFTANPNPITLAAGTTVGKTTLTWSAPGHNLLEIFAGSTLFAAGLPSTGSADTGGWVRDGLTFSLVDLVSAQAIARVTVVGVTDTDVTLFHDSFGVQGDRLDSTHWTTEVGHSSFLGRTQLADWVTPGGVGKFVVGASGSELSLSTFNPTGFSFYATHGKTIASFQPTANTTLTYTARLQLKSLQPGIVWGVYFYGCPGPCATQHDEIDIELVTNLLQPGSSSLSVQVNNYSNEPLGAGNGALINLPAGFDALAVHDWTIRWSLQRVDYLLDGTLLASADTHVPQGPMQVNVIAWAPAADWGAAYSPLLQPVRGAEQNQTFTAVLSTVTVSSSSPAIAPFDDLTCASGTIRPTGLNAGYASFHRFEPDWKPSNTGDYRVYGNRVGGIGNTLEYLGCAGANYVWLAWQFGGFQVFAVRAPWAGQTDRGLSIGDDSTRFHALYPQARRPVEPFPNYYLWPPDFDVWDVGPLRVVLRSGRVSLMQVDWSFNNGAPDTNESTSTVIGPCCDALHWY